jgi:hypothetical protein
LKDNHIFDNDNLQCVAGGAAVHQLYRYHTERKWRGAITPTLSENIWIVNNHPVESKKKAVLLGKKMDELPINGDSYLSGKEIFPVTTYSNKGKDLFDIDILQGELKYPVVRINYQFEDFFKLGLGRLFPKGVLIRYVIDDYEMIQQLLVTPGTVVSGWGWSKTKIEYNILTEEGSDGINLRKIDSLNRKEVERLRRNFIPGG